jgi:hypothetical protein
MKDRRDKRLATRSERERFEVESATEPEMTDLPFSHTTARIQKLLDKGLSCASIAKKIGRPNEIDRVHKVGCNCAAHLDWDQLADDGNLAFAIKHAVATDAEKDWLHSKGLVIQDIIEGHFPADLAPNLRTLVNGWNERAGHTIFHLEAFDF